jgi:hypothetical protein
MLINFNKGTLLRALRVSIGAVPPRKGHLWASAVQILRSVFGNYNTKFVQKHHGILRYSCDVLKTFLGNLKLLKAAFTRDKNTLHNWDFVTSVRQTDWQQHNCTSMHRYLSHPLGTRSRTFDEEVRKNQLKLVYFKEKQQ